MRCIRMLLIALFMAVIVVVGIAVFHVQLLSGYARLFTVDNPTPGADMILVLSGNLETRADKAIQLYRAGYGPKISFTTPKRWNSRFDTLIGSVQDHIHILMGHENVPYEFIPTSGEGVRSTYEEAADFIRYARANNVDHVIVVTDAFHSRRARFAFQRVLEHSDADIKLEVAAAGNEIYDDSNWWKTEKGLIDYISEPFKFAFYYFNLKELNLIKDD